MIWERRDKLHFDVLVGISLDLFIHNVTPQMIDFLIYLVNSCSTALNHQFLCLNAIVYYVEWVEMKTQNKLTLYSVQHCHLLCKQQFFISIVC